MLYVIILYLPPPEKGQDFGEALSRLSEAAGRMGTYESAGARHYRPFDEAMSRGVMPIGQQGRQIQDVKHIFEPMAQSVL